MGINNLLKALTLAILLPASTTASTLHLTARNNPGWVYTCPVVGFKGACEYREPGYCHRFPDASKIPQSIGPDCGGYCVFYRNLDCRGPIAPVILVDGTVIT